MRSYPAGVPTDGECTLEEWLNHRMAEAALLALMPEAKRFDFQKDQVQSSIIRLTGWGIPLWILDFRNRWVTMHNQPWGREFTFRTEVALVGLQFLYLAQDARTEAYRRVVLGFVLGALRPLVDHAEASQEYAGLLQICQLCESDGLYMAPQRWRDIHNRFGSHVVETPAKTRAKSLVDDFIRIACSGLFQPDTPQDRNVTGVILFHLGKEYQSCFRKDRAQTDRIVQAFLNALEAECPPPDWLPLS